MQSELLRSLACPGVNEKATHCVVTSSVVLILNTVVGGFRQACLRDLWAGKENGSEFNRILLV